jgi:hypothetical protein
MMFDGEQGLASHNNAMYGSINEWLYRSLSRIYPAVDAVDFDKAVIRSQATDSLECAVTTHRSAVTSPCHGAMMPTPSRSTISPNMTAVIDVPTDRSADSVIIESLQEVLSGCPGRGSSPELEVQAVEDESVVFDADKITYDMVVH